MRWTAVVVLTGSIGYLSLDKQLIASVSEVRMLLVWGVSLLVVAGTARRAQRRVEAPANTDVPPSTQELKLGV